MEHARLPLDIHSGDTCAGLVHHKQVPEEQAGILHFPGSRSTCTVCFDTTLLGPVGTTSKRPVPKSTVFDVYFFTVAETTSRSSRGVCGCYRDTEFNPSQPPTITGNLAFRLPCPPMPAVTWRCARRGERGQKCGRGGDGKWQMSTWQTVRRSETLPSRIQRGIETMSRHPHFTLTVLVFLTAWLTWPAQMACRRRPAAVPRWRGH